MVQTSNNADCQHPLEITNKIFLGDLTHWGQNKMADVLQTTFEISLECVSVSLNNNKQHWFS